MLSAAAFSAELLAKPESITVPLSVSTLMDVPATAGLFTPAQVLPSGPVTACSPSA